MNSFTTKLDDGRPVIVYFLMLEAEPEVGLMSNYAEIESVELENGERVTLTSSEDQRIFEEACQRGRERLYDYDE